MEVSGQIYALVSLPPDERVSDTHWLGDRVGPGATLDAVAKRKICLALPGIEPRSSGL
jgi:hypothetical protein